MAPKRRSNTSKTIRTSAARGRGSSRTAYDGLTYSDLAALPRMSAAPPKHPKQKKAPSGPPSRLATALPQALFHHVLTFALSDTRTTPEYPQDAARLQLCIVAQVSKAWYAHASELASQLLLGRTIVQLRSCSRRELLAVRHKLTLRRAFLRELRVVVAPEPVFFSVRNDTSVPRATRFFAAALKDAPKLELLDLRSYDASSADIATVLNAAATNCPQIQSLLLPPLEPRRSSSSSDVVVPNARDVQLVADALYHAMQKWHHHGTNGGLRQLRLPNRQSSQRFATSVEFLRHVAMHCPRIELLDTRSLTPGSFRPDQWIVDRATWAQFCATCAHLRAFDWSVAPYATSFFQIFGQHVKPQLTQLTLAALRPWTWDDYYQDVGDHEAVAVRVAGVGAQARDIHHVLRACPALTTLKVNLHSPRIPVEDYGGRMEVVQIGDNTPEDPLAAATKNSMNQELFGDEFVDALCKSCPLIEELTMAHDDVLGGLFCKRSEPITAFTDRALRRLATLPYLSTLELKSVNVSGKGLFELINSAANHVSSQRDYDLRIGDNEGPCEMGFYRALEGFLRSLQQNTKPLCFTDKKLVLHVANSKTTSETSKWSETYLARLRTALKAVRAKYPTLQFRIEMSGLTTKSFQRIAAFGVFTTGATPFDEYEWTRLQHGALVDGALLRQELMGPVDDYEDDYDDYYDEYDEEDLMYGRHDGYYGDYQNERGHYGMGGYHFYNGLQLDDAYGDDMGDYGDY